MADITKDYKEEQEQEQEQQLPRRRCNLNDFAVPLTLNIGMLPNKADVNKKWNDRCNTSFNQTSSFIYEIIYPAMLNMNIPQPLMLKPYVVKSSIGSNNSIECCAVSDQQNFNFNQQIVHPGDIVLGVNDTEIFGVYNYHDSLDKVLDTSILRVVKFFRPAALTQNLLPSIAEIRLFMEEKDVISKYSVNINSAINGYNYDLVAHEPSLVLYPAVAKMLKRQRVLWEVSPGPDRYYSMSGIESYSSGTNGKWIPYGKLRRGVYADRDKYIVVGELPFAHVATDSSVSRRFYYGRYSSEEMALQELERERELKISSGGFYRLEPLHVPQPVTYQQPNLFLNTATQNTSTVNPPLIPGVMI